MNVLDLAVKIPAGEDWVIFTDALGRSFVGHLNEIGAVSHNHDSNYAALIHNHDSNYAALTHSHSGYAASNHSHGYLVGSEEQISADTIVSHIADSGLHSGGGGGGYPRNYNSLLYVYKDAATVTVAANGQATTADGTITHTLTAATDVSLASDLDTGSEAANTLYYLWIGTITGTVTLKFSASATSPTGLTNPVRLRGAVRNDASSNILPFAMDDSTYRYDVDCTCDGFDVTEVFDDVTPTSFTDMDCSAFVPSGCRQVLFLMSLNAGGEEIRVRPKGSVAVNGTIAYLAPVGFYPSNAEFSVDDLGVFQFRADVASSYRCSVLGYRG